jgi:hypothetical protein
MDELTVDGRLLVQQGSYDADANAAVGDCPSRTKGVTTLAPALDTPA